MGTDGGEPPGSTGDTSKKKGGRRFIRPPRPAKFEGSCVNLKGNVFGCVGNMADSFVKTQEQIAICVGGKNTCGGLMAKAVETLAEPVTATPSPPANYGDPTKVDQADKHLWEQEVKEAIRDKRDLKRGTEQLCSLVIGQCSEAMIARVDNHSDHAKVLADRDGISLLVIIKSTCFNFHDQKHVLQSIHEAKVRFYSMRQGHFDTVTQHCEKCQNNVQVLDQCGGDIGLDTGVWKMTCLEQGMSNTTTDSDELKKVQTLVKDRMLATGFILGADRFRHGSMIRNFENAFTTGRNEWPKTLVDACRTLSNWKRENTGSVQLESEGVSFGTDGATEGAGKDCSNALCWRCRKQGHLKRDCAEPDPDSGAEGNANVQDGAETGEQLLLGAIEDGEFDDSM